MNAPALVKITDFLDLRPGWCYGEGTGFERETANQARQIVTALLAYGFDTLDAFPGLNGEIRITAYVQTHYLEFTLENAAGIAFGYEVADQEQDYQEGLGLDECVEIIKNLSHLCNSYASFIKNISTATGAGSKAWRSDPPRTGGSPLLITSAPWTTPGLCVSTYATTTPMSAVAHRCSGDSTPRSCQVHT